MSRKWKASLLVVLALVSFVSALFLSKTWETRRIKSRTCEHLQQSFGDIPVLSEARLIHQRYYGCPKCRFAGMMALYSTELSPEAARAFYLGHFQASQWDSVGQWEGQHNGQLVQWGVRAEWPFAGTDFREETIMFLAQESRNASALWFTPVKATKRAIASGRTIYIIQIVYTEDRAVRDRECLPYSGGECEKDWWELNVPESESAVPDQLALSRLAEPQGDGILAYKAADPKGF